MAEVSADEESIDDQIRRALVGLEAQGLHIPLPALIEKITDLAAKDGCNMVTALGRLTASDLAALFATLAVPLPSGSPSETAESAEDAAKPHVPTDSLELPTSPGGKALMAPSAEPVSPGDASSRQRKADNWDIFRNDDSPYGRNHPRRVPSSAAEAAAHDAPPNFDAAAEL